MSEENTTPESIEIPQQANTAESVGTPPEPCVNGESGTTPPAEKIGNFPPEIAALLMVAGVAGILLPGPIGTPLLIAGGVVLWPKTFRPIEDWFCRKFPAMHHEGVVQLKEFLGDLDRRFPDQ